MEMSAGSNAWKSLLLLFLFALGFSSKAAEAAREYEVKAAFLFNFAKFVEWPTDRLPPNAPLIIGVLGEDPFKDDLEKVIGNREVLGHPIKTVRFNSPRDAASAHILFISSSERRRIEQTLAALAGKGVLTVGDIDNFCEEGGVIQFRTIEDKIRFEVNTSAADNQNLKISSRLLTVASKVWK